MKKYRVEVNGESFDFSEKDVSELDSFFNEKLQAYHMINKNRSVTANVLDVKKDNPKSITVFINGTRYITLIKDELDMMIKEMGLAVQSKNESKDLIAPMPGLILDVLVNKGDDIKEGDTLLILEAMKMENTLKSSSEGKVKSINAKNGEIVEKGSIIIEIV